MNDRRRHRSRGPPLRLLSDLGVTLVAGDLRCAKVAGRRIVNLDTLEALLKASGTPPPDRAD